MKIVVIGGTGLIGSKTVAILGGGGHEVVAASPNTGVNSVTGEGLKEAMAGTQVVIDLANSPSFEYKAVLEFFETSGRGRPAPYRAIDRRNRPVRQWLFSRQGRARETDTPASPTPSSARPSSWNSSAVSSLQVRMKT